MQEAGHSRNVAALMVYMTIWHPQKDKLSF